MPSDLEEKKRTEQESASSAAVGYGPMAILAGLGALLLIAGIVGIMIFSGGAGIPVLAAMAAVAGPAMTGTGLMFAITGAAAGGLILGASVVVPVWKKRKENVMIEDVRGKLNERSISITGNAPPQQEREEKPAPVFQAAPPPPSDLPPLPPVAANKFEDIVLPPMPAIGGFDPSKGDVVDLPPPPKSDGLLKDIQDAKKNLKPVQHKDTSPEGVKKERADNRNVPPGKV